MKQDLSQVFLSITGIMGVMSIKSLGRIHELDLLRGFFILVILIDHFQRWPSPFTLITGEGRLWVSAAEGFFIISGLLIGYLRGWKSRHLAFKEIAAKLVSRGAMLYIWCIGITFFVVSMTVLISDGTSPLVPKLPASEQLINLPTYIWTVITSQYASDWIYFLRLYAIILVVSPLIVWLLRKGLWWVVLVLSWGTYALSFFMVEPEGAMQWQLLFFNAAIIGWKLETIVGYLRTHPRFKKWLAISLMGVTLITMILSYFWVFGWNNVEGPHPIISRDSYVTARGSIDPWFTNNPMAIGRILLSFVWFGGLIFFFHTIRGWLMKWFGWLLMPFGQNSLTVYCLQAITLLFIEVIVPMSQSGIINTISTLVVILLIWGLVKIPIVSRILPR